ncbi:M48 family metallopeptidase [Ureaplasma urealyticum]|uniref:M48 family metallopeptidase n=1 Tax=Ureaplasma urealyticum TaxID=2130 RepID=UPI0001793C1C|nr:M48 family metallopeptidase [Ureaplasma urealyticum]EDX53896.1 conserved hypothetical protein [Ureaplasma urealyticum serovar 9 str. ATCC 33175]EDX53016.1 conserved hypothetical protein [Ureaplasma urealyticum serovar 12 str. ATCC 33696]EDY74449.1 conserved hypothetical protein [Ureaplasma urealyticum serovar 4 str. ATCC 27816]MDU3865010.1 M48 family metallopeptidase [Ureaplasma urealyticum]UIU15366.1 M48 family metallopeptidase [Ureaplasma urealyticum]
MLNFVKDLNFEINQKKIIVKVCLQPKIKYIKIKIINHEIVCLINNLTLVDIAQDFVINNKLKILKLYENDLKRIKYDEQHLNWIILLGTKFSTIKLVNNDFHCEFDLQKQIIYIYDQNQNLANSKLIYQKILKYLAEIIFSQIIKNAENITNLAAKEYEFGFYKSRWGVYDKLKHIIKLSYFLVHYDQEIIQYVVIHELAHIKYQHHQNSFWDFVLKYCKNAKIYNKQLKS